MSDPTAEDLEQSADEASQRTEEMLDRRFRIHGVGNVTGKPGKLEMRTQILVEDEDQCDVRIRIERDTVFSSDPVLVSITDDNLLDLMDIFHRVSQRRGL